MNYQQDIKFAFTILNHREMLNDEVVVEWLKDPAHLALMNDTETVSQLILPGCERRSRLILFCL